MAYFAKIEDNIVTQVIVVANDVLLDPQGNEVEQKGREFCSILLGGDWVQSSYNSTFRKNSAGIGFTYDTNRDAFIPPKPFDSWLLDEDTCLWGPPIPHPTDNQLHTWNEESMVWEDMGL
jgi:hypothetical protein